MNWIIFRSPKSFTHFQQIINIAIANYINLFEFINSLNIFQAVFNRSWNVDNWPAGIGLMSDIKSATKTLFSPGSSFFSSRFLTSMCLLRLDVKSSSSKKLLNSKSYWSIYDISRSRHLRISIILWVYEISFCCYWIVLRFKVGVSVIFKVLEVFIVSDNFFDFVTKRSLRKTFYCSLPWVK